MKKLTQWATIIFSSIVLILMLLGMGITAYDVLNGNVRTPMDVREILSMGIGFLIAIGVLLFILIQAIKKVQKAPRIVSEAYDKELNISLKGKIEYKDYRNLILGITYKKPAYIVIYGIAILFVLTFIINLNKAISEFETQYLVMVVVFGLLLLSPIFTLVQIKKLYNTNAIFKEEINYVLNNDAIQIKGSTVNSTQSWNHFYQIKETKAFLMFYHGKNVATLLDKQMFSDADLIEFKSFIKSLNIKKSII